MNALLTRCFSGALVSFLLLLPVQSTWAQAELSDKEKAFIYFDFRNDLLLETDAVKTIGSRAIDDALSEMFLKVEATELIRINGVIGAPNDLDDMDEVSETLSLLDRLAFEFATQYELKTEAAALAMMNDFGLDVDNPVEIDGSQFYQLSGDNGSQKLLALKKSETTFLLGTKRFIAAEEIQSLFCNELQEVWGRQAQDSPLRVSFAGKTHADYIKKAREFFIELDPMTLFRFTEKMESMNLAIDPDSEEMIALRAIGNDEASAKDLREEMNALLQMAKLMGAQLSQRLETESPILAKTTASISESLKAVGEGREVNIVVPKPATMLEACEALSRKINGGRKGDSDDGSPNK